MMEKRLMPGLKMLYVLKIRRLLSHSNAGRNVKVRFPRLQIVETAGSAGIWGDGLKSVNARG